MAWQTEKVLRTNYAVNPAYRATSGTTTVRTNLCTNPSLGSNTADFSYWAGTGGAGTVTWQSGSDTPRGTSGYGRITWNTAPSTGGGVTYGFKTVDPSTTYTFSIYIRSSVALTMYCQVQWYNNGVPTTNTGSPASGYVSLPANQWKRMSITTASGASDNQYQFRVYTVGAGIQVGTTIDYDDCLIEATSVLQPYFDGSSKLNLLPNSSQANSNNGVAYPAVVDKDVSRTGNLGSMRFETTGSGNTILTTYGNGGATSAGVPVTAGVTYTFTTWVLLEGKADANGYTVMNWKNSSGSVFDSVRADNVFIPQGSGWTRMTVTGVAPVGAVAMYPTAAVVKASGPTVPGEDVGWITDNLLEAGATSPGPFYQGLTPAWSGAANASQSVLQGAKADPATAATNYASLAPFGWVTGNGSYCTLSPITRPGSILTLFSNTTPFANPKASPGEYWSGQFEARLVPGSCSSTVSLYPWLYSYSTSGSLGAISKNNGSVELPLDGSWQTCRAVSAIPMPDSTDNIRWFITTSPTNYGGAIIEFRNFVTEKVSGPGISAGPYFDGSTPGTTNPYVSYRWTGAVETSYSQQFLPQQLLPAYYDSRSKAAGYQGTYYVDYMDLQNFAFGISKVAHAVPQLRGNHTTIPGRSGITPRFNRSYESAELQLSMWVIGCETDGSVPGIGTKRYSLFKRNLQALLTILSAQNGISTLMWTPPDTVTNEDAYAAATLYANVITNGVTSLETMAARRRAELTVSLTITDSFWRGGQVNASSGPSATLPQSLTLSSMGSAPIEDAKITITGPVAIPRVTCSSSNVWVQYNGNLAAGQTLVIDAAAGTATINGASVMDKITHGGHPLLMYIPPRTAGVLATAPLSTASTLTLSGSGASSATNMSVQFFTKYLVGI